MTTIETTCTDRKKMVAGISERLGVPAEYLRAPTYAYRIGKLTVNRDASVTGEDDDLLPAALWLLEQGYITAVPFQPEVTSAEDSEAQLAEEQEEPTVEDSEAKATPEAGEEPQITQTNISIPTDGMTAEQLSNLLKLLYARQKLIAAMAQSDFLAIGKPLIDRLNEEKPTEPQRVQELLREATASGTVCGISLDDGKLTMEFPFQADEPTGWEPYAALMNAVLNLAKTARRVNTTISEPGEDEMKYCCHAWLIQLGFGGPDHKAERKALVGHLKGYAAFRTTEKMDAHKAKYAVLRKQRKEADS